MIGEIKPRDLLVLVAFLFVCWLTGFAADRVHLRSSGRSLRGNGGASLTNESLKKELIRLQKEQGLSVIWNDRDSIQFVVFGSKRVAAMKGISIPGDALIVAISPAITRIAVLRPFPPLTSGHLEILRKDGTVDEKFPELFGGQMCWSPDDSKVVLTASDRQDGGLRDPGLRILDLSSGVTKSIDPAGQVTSQCWSSNANEFVYGLSGAVWLYDTRDARSHQLAQGHDPTWSPDGAWIAFDDHDAYYAIRSNGDGKKLLFKKKNPGGGLVWSPDSRMVAYSSQAGLLQSFPVIDVEVYRLHFRRLDDGSEYSIDRNISGTGFQWMTDPEFVAAQHPE
jgi:WD40-like Beta Propeller Repeat